MSLFNPCNDVFYYSHTAVLSGTHSRDTLITHCCAQQQRSSVAPVAYAAAANATAAARAMAPCADAFWSSCCSCSSCCTTALLPLCLAGAAGTAAATAAATAAVAAAADAAAAAVALLDANQTAPSLARQARAQPASSAVFDQLRCHLCRAPRSLRGFHHPCCAAAKDVDMAELALRPGDCLQIPSHNVRVAQTIVLFRPPATAPSLTDLFKNSKKTKRLFFSSFPTTTCDSIFLF